METASGLPKDKECVRATGEEANNLMLQISSTDGEVQTRGIEGVTGGHELAIEERGEMLSDSSTILTSPESSASDSDTVAARGTNTFARGLRTVAVIGSSCIAREAAGLNVAADELKPNVLRLFVAAGGGGRSLQASEGRGGVL